MTSGCLPIPRRPGTDQGLAELDWEAGRVSPLRFLRAFLAGACLQAVLVGVLPARAVEPVNVRTDAAAIDLTPAVDRQRMESDRILVSTAPGTDGIVQRMDVRAREGNTSWAVFALANSAHEVRSEEHTSEL